MYKHVRRLRLTPRQPETQTRRRRGARNNRVFFELTPMRWFVSRSIRFWQGLVWLVDGVDSYYWLRSTLIYLSHSGPS